MKDTTPIRIIFVCGPSGAGKTTFAESLAAKYGWLHVPADPIPGGRFEHLGFRLAWRAFDRFGIGRLLAMDLRRTAAARGATGCVVTFPSNIVIPSDHPAALANGIDVVYLHGSREHCIRAYLEREKETGRNFPLGRWERFNDDLYARLERPGSPRGRSRRSRPTVGGCLSKNSSRSSIVFYTQPIRRTAPRFLASRGGDMIACGNAIRA